MSRPLRWLLLASHVPATGVKGGMVRYVVETATALSARDDVELHVAVRPEARALFTALLGAPERVHPLPDLPTPVLSVVERTTVGARVMRGDVSGAFDVVHGAKHLLPRRVGGARRVLTVHDMILFDRPGDFPGLKRHALRVPYRASLAEADVLLCVSAATRERVCAQDPSARGRSAVVPLAPSRQLLAAVPTPLPQLLGRRFALVVGDPSPRKNLPFAMDVWSEVVRHDPDAVLAVVGPSGWGTDARGAAYARLVAAGSVLPLGHVDDAALRWCYEQARVVLCPSLLEGFGLPVAEAQAFGAPVVTSQDPALVEAAGGRGAALPLEVARWATALLPLLRDGAARPAPVRARTWDDVAAETVAAVRGEA